MLGGGWKRPRALGAVMIVACALAGAAALTHAHEALDGPRILQEAREAILDGRLDEAEQLLDGAEVPLDAVDAALLRGLIALHRGEMETAASRFEEVVASEPDRPVAWIYLAHAYLAQGRYQGALEALEAAGSLGEEMAGVTQLRARALEGVGRPRRALETLEDALARFPGDADLHEEHVFFYLRAGLSGRAVEAATRYREVASRRPRAWILLAEAHRTARDDEAATMVLEEARLRFPGAHEIGEQLAYTYALRRLPVAAARLYESLSYTGRPHAFAVADQLRLAGDYDRALVWNARVLDEADRLDQRLAILVGQERYARAVVVGELAMERDVLTDGALYTFGYAAVLAGRPVLAAEISTRLRASGRPENAERLDGLIDRCREEPWLCQ